MSTKKEFGEWQAPIALADRVVTLVSELSGVPECFAVWNT